MKIVFMGTPEFAVPCLEVCHEFAQVVGVFTQPDRPKGRGKKLAPPPVKEKAESLGLAIYQPERIKTPEAVAQLKALEPDLIIVVAYGQLLSKEILEMPTLGCINVHASLLPKLRGASPINWAIVTGEKETGVTTMFMSEGLDEGDMLHKIGLNLDDTINAQQLHDALMALGAQVLMTTLKAVAEGSLSPQEQNHSLSNYAPILKKEMGKINWEKTSWEISCLIRGFDPWPVAHTTLLGQTMKLFAPKVADQGMENVKDVPAGTILEVGAEGLLVKTGSGALWINAIQMPNGKRMSVGSYILGNSLPVGVVLGE